jgi:ribonuclease HI
MPNMERVIVYTDGGSRGNPGPAGIGVVIQSVEGAVLKEYGETLEGERTNNEAEYEAVIFALKKLKALMGKEKTRNLHVEFRVDSELIAAQLSGNYKVEEQRLQLLYMKVHNLKFSFGGISFTAVAREKNARADWLLNQALDKDKGRLF